MNFKRVSIKFEYRVIQKDIFKVKNIETGTIMSNKPTVILNLVNENFKNIKIYFMEIMEEKFLEILKDWELEYEEKSKIKTIYKYKNQKGL